MHIFNNHFVVAAIIFFK